MVRPVISFRGINVDKKCKNFSNFPAVSAASTLLMYMYKLTVSRIEYFYLYHTSLPLTCLYH